MEDNESTPLVLMWWNTSLSPVAKPRKNPADKAYVVAAVGEMFRTLRADVFALGEVCSQDLRDIHAAIGVPNVSLHDATAYQGKAQFDTGVLYNRNRLAVATTRSVLDSYGTTTLKLGERLTLRSQDAAREIHLFISHWPRRLFCHETDHKRIEIGTALRRELDRIRRSVTPPEFIVLMGDYNDDPYSPSLAHHLLATRDRELAQKNNKFLYNPFWRLLGESAPFVSGRVGRGICGTYYYSGGEHGRWHTFDQIMFSSAFLGNGPLILNEEKCQIVRSESIESRMRSTDVFDHLPVMSVIDVRRTT
jgi:hypothetical protein